MLNQGPPILLAVWKSPEVVGYFSLPFRILSSLIDIIPQIGMVMGTNVMQLVARGEWEAVQRATSLINRYCLTIFLCPAAFLLIYGDAFFRWYVGPEVGEHITPMLPWLLLGFTLGLAAQQNSSAMLFGIASHQSFSWGLIAESLLLMGTWWWIIPRYDLLTAVAVLGLLMFLNRGLRTSWLACQALSISWGSFLREIYLLPLVAAAVTGAAVYALRWVVPGQSIYQLALAALFTSLLYAALCWRLVIEPEHRALLLKFWK